MAAQVVEVNESIIDYFGEVMGFQNESKEHRNVTTNEFKDHLSKALTVDGKKVVVLWWKDGVRADGDFKSRLVKEQAQLQERHEKLVLFIASDGFDKLDTVQKNLLFEQSDAMHTYNKVLKERLARL